MKYFSIEELCRSEKAKSLGIVNNPGEEQKENLVALIQNVLDPVRELYGKPIIVSSGFRGAKLNSKVGGETNSQHKKGEAADLVVSAGAKGNYEIGKLIVNHTDFDQVIFEDTSSRNMLPSWIHVSYKRNGGNRHMILRKVKGSKCYTVISKDRL